MADETGNTTVATAVLEVQLMPVVPPVEETQAKVATPELLVAPATPPAPALVVSQAAEQAAPALVVSQPAYVCKNKKHGSGQPYLILEGTAFCNLCLRDFLKQRIRPMRKNETP